MTGDVKIWPKTVCNGLGALAQLPRLLADLGVGRAMVVCGRTVANGPILAQVKAALGPAYAGCFDRVQSHTPLGLVQEAAELLRELGADVVVSVGGGSAIDCGKGIAIYLATGGDFEPYRVRRSAQDKSRRAVPPGITHIAIPTTAGSASDVMPTAGIRNVETREKLLFWDDALIPAATVLDPEIASHTGAMLTATSGMTAVARCVESLYSRERNPLAAGLALQGLRLMAEGLPAAVENPGDLEARMKTQAGCVLSGIAAINSMVSVVHAVGHVIGGRLGLQHGTSHSMMLPPAMRLLLPVIGEDQHLVAQALGGDSRGLDAAAAGRLAADRMEALLDRLPIGRRLRDAGLPEEEIDAIAAHAPEDYMMRNLPRPMEASEVAALIRAAW